MAPAEALNLDALATGKTYSVSNVFNKAEIRLEHIEIVGKERINLTGLHDEFYLTDTIDSKGQRGIKREMRSNSLILSISLKNLIGIVEVAQGSESLLLLAKDKHAVGG